MMLKTTGLASINRQLSEVKKFRILPGAVFLYTKTPQQGGFTRIFKVCLHVEQEMHYVAILNDIFLSLG